MDQVTYLIGAVTTLAGVVVFLFKLIMQLSKDHARMNGELGELKGRQQGIEDLSDRVLKTVEEATKK